MNHQAYHSPFTTFCEGIENIEKGYKYFTLFHRRNFLEFLPLQKDAHILVVSSGVGYFQNSLRVWGYTNVIGIDSDEQKINYAMGKGFQSIVGNCFEYLKNQKDEYDFIFTEQEVNHLTRDELIDFLKKCHRALKQGGALMIIAANSANPIIATEYLGNNIDHYTSIAENGMYQYLNLCGFMDVKIFPHDFYVIWYNPLNYVAKLITTMIHVCLKMLFILYGKKNKIFTKRLGAVAYKK